LIELLDWANEFILESRHNKDDDFSESNDSVDLSDGTSPDTSPRMSAVTFGHRGRRW